MIFYIFCIAAVGVQLTFGNYSGGGKHRSRQTDHEDSYRCAEEGFHPDPRDCKKFYRCVNLNANYEKKIFLNNFVKPQYIAYEFECPQGTIFNTDYNVCAHSQNTRRSECGGNNGDQVGSNFQPNQMSQYKMPYATQNPNKYSQTPGLGRQENLTPSGSPEICTSPGYFPVKGNCHKFINCVDNGMGGFTKFEFACGPGTVWDPEKTVCNHPSVVPNCDQGGNGEGNPGQGGYPSPGESPGQGGYPGQGESPGQGGYPGQGGSPGQGGYPGPGGSPGQGGYPGPGGSPGQGGYPGPGGSPGQGGYPGPGGSPGQGGYPGPGGSPGQGGYPGPGGSPGQGGYPGPGGSPGQGGYPGPGGSPGQGGYPGQGGSPGQGGYPSPGGSPGQGGYPGPGGSPGQGGYPGPGGSPGQGGYPGAGSTPHQESTPQPSEAESDRIFPGECKSSGFYAVKGNCQKYIRCVDKGNGGYNKFEFECGPGTVWDSQLNTCNYPSSVKGCENSYDQSSFTQTTSSFTTQTTSSFNSSSTSSTSQTQQSTTTFVTNQTTSQSQTTSGLLSSTNQSSKPPELIEQGSTSPLTPTTESSTETSTGTNYQTSAPPGSFPCDQNKPSSPVKCEKEGFYPHPDDCKKFYRCVDWDGSEGKRFSVYNFECANGTIWDPALQSCNHEMSVYPPRNCKKPDNQATEKPSSTTSPEQPSSTPTTSQPETLTTNIGSTSTPSSSLATTTPNETKDTTSPTDTTDSTTINPTTSAVASPETISSTDSSITTNSSPETTSMSSTDSAATTDSLPETTSISSTDITSSTASSPETTTMSSTEQGLSENTDSTNSSPSATEQTTSLENSSPTESTSTDGPVTDPSTESSTEQASESSTAVATDSTISSIVTEPSQTSTPSPLPDSADKCPPISGNQVTFACPTGFKRHPKDCHMFYQCTTSTEMEDVNIVTFTCGGDTYFDDQRIQCLPPDQTEPCKTQKQKRKARNISEHKSSVVHVSANKKLCPKVGSFSYEGDCTRYYKCVKNEKGKIEGYMYQCPKNYIFSATSNGCEKMSKLSRCGRSIPEVTQNNLNWLTLKVPTEYTSPEA